MIYWECVVIVVVFYSKPRLNPLILISGLALGISRPPTSSACLLYQMINHLRDAQPDGI